MLAAEAAWGDRSARSDMALYMGMLLRYEAAPALPALAARACSLIAFAPSETYTPGRGRNKDV